MISADGLGNLDAGGPGAALTWDFSTLRSNGASSTTSYSYENSTTYVSDLLERTPDGKKIHLQQNNSTTYVKAIEDSLAGTTVHYYDYTISRRPFTYQTSYVDSYRVESTQPAMTGTGYLTVTGDAYGALELPTGTYDNVLRIKKLQVETDSLDYLQHHITSISYLWFDAEHSAPLLRIDSMISETGTSSDIMYLGAPTAVNNIGSSPQELNGNINNNELLLTGTFEPGVTYDLVVYNIIGTKMFTTAFTASGGALRFDMGRDINPGIYVVSLNMRNDPSSRQIIKVVKQ